MGKKCSLTEVERGQIVAFHKEGYTERQIGAKLGFSKTAVHQALVKFSRSGSYSDAKRSGRPRKATLRADIFIERQVTKS